MSLETIENILASLIKNGDKDTLNSVIELLEEIRDYKKPSKTFHQHSSKPSEKYSQRTAENSRAEFGARFRWTAS